MQFDDLTLGLLPFIRRGHCCSQLLMDMALSPSGREEPGLVHAMRGLCLGLGGAGCECGLLSGGAAVLAWLSRDQSAASMPDAMVNDYAQWFRERTADCGMQCDGITAFLARQQGAEPRPGSRDMSLCTPLLSDCWQKIVMLCDEYGIDMEEED